MYDCLNIHKTHSLCYSNLYSNHLTHALNNMIASSASHNNKENTLTLVTWHNFSRKLLISPHSQYDLQCSEFKP